MRNKTIGMFTLIFTLASTSICNSAQKKQAAEPPDPERAIGCMRTINTAELAYKQTYNNGYSPTLAAMGVKPGVTDYNAEAAGLIDENLTRGRMAGYVFTYKAGRKEQGGSISGYTVTARPAVWKEGLVSYFSDETGVIRWTKARRAPTAKDPSIDSLEENK